MGFSFKKFSQSSRERIGPISKPFLIYPPYERFEDVGAPSKPSAHESPARPALPDRKPLKPTHRPPVLKANAGNSGKTTGAFYSSNHSSDPTIHAPLPPANSYSAEDYTYKFYQAHPIQTLLYTGSKMLGYRDSLTMLDSNSFSCPARMHGHAASRYYDTGYDPFDHDYGDPFEPGYEAKCLPYTEPAPQQPEALLEAEDFFGGDSDADIDAMIKELTAAGIAETKGGAGAHIVQRTESEIDDALIDEMLQLWLEIEEESRQNEALRNNKYGHDSSVDSVLDSIRIPLKLY